VTRRSGRSNTVGIVMTWLGAFVMLCAVGGMLAFRVVFGRHPQLAETSAIRVVWKHFGVLASVQLGVGVVLVLIGLVLIWRGRPSSLRLGQ
jgi:hypothetical protein